MSINFYARLEPVTRSDDLQEGLAARVYDPAWTLSRQLQFGELLGDDGGSPVTARHIGRISWCTAYADRAERRELAPGEGPVEPMAESVPAAWNRRLRVDVGRALVRCVRTAGLADRVQALLTAFPLAPEGDLATGRVPDGALAHETLVPSLRLAPPTLPGLPGLVVDQPLVEAALGWLEFCDGLLPPTASAWSSADLDHGFALEAPGVTLTADHHDGGALEWWAFDATPTEASPSDTTPTDATGPLDTDAHDQTTVPTRVTFHGMPMPRWWQEEDAVVDLGGVEAHPADLARMAVLQFALLYGNDHFVIPVRQPVGTLFRTTHLLVSDVFGATTLIPPATGTAARWTMYTPSLARSPGVSDAFVLPAAAVQPLTSGPVEEVLLLRDEMANLGWAVESTVEGPYGEPVHRAEQWHRSPDTQPAPSGPLTYQLGTTVPPHWFPLLPRRSDTGDVPEHVIQAMTHSAGPSAVPQGDFIALGNIVADDRLPREGRRLVRERVLARAADGTTFVWSRRTARIGRGEGASGLAFDLAQFD